MKLLHYYALSSRVLVVAVKREIGWCAYCDAVPGVNHVKELYPVIHCGDKLPERIARSIFPSIPLPYEG